VLLGIEPVEQRRAGAPIWRKPVGEGAKRVTTESDILGKAYALEAVVYSRNGT